MSKTVQILFLLDVNSSLDCSDDVEELNRRVRVVRLACLKILTYFLHRQTPDCNSCATVRWNYKYYSSVSSRRIKTPIRRTFREFNTDEFDEFEAQVNRKVRTERELLIQSGEKTAISSPCSSKASSSHAERLNIALKEILCDFVWDSPDIASPVQTRKRGENVEDDSYETKRDNYVFIVSKCPNTLNGLKMFLNWELNSHKSKSRSINTDTVFQCLMSRNVFSTYKNNLRIRVFWLDLGDGDFVITNEDVKGRQIISEILKKLLGKIIQISNVVHLSECHSLPSESLLDFCVDHVENLMPKFKSSLNWEFPHLDCPLDLIPLEKENKYFSLGIFTSDADIHPVFVAGLIKKKLWTDANKVSFACTASDSSETFSNLLISLCRNEQFIVVNCNGNVGLLYPISLTAAALDFVRLGYKILPRKERGRPLTSPTTPECKLTADAFGWAKYVRNLSHPFLPVTEVATSNNSQLFTFNFISKWFIPQPVSCGIAVTHEQKARKERERDLFDKLRQRLRVESSSEIEVREPAVPVVKRPTKISSSLKSLVSQRTQSLVLNAQEQASSSAEDTSLIRKANNSDLSGKEDSVDILLKSFDIDDEDKLITQVKDYYKSAVDTDLSLIVSATNIINVVMFHTSEKYGERREKPCRDLLEKQLFKTATSITETYHNCESERSDARGREFELQALLRTEALIAIDGGAALNKYAEEAVALLKKLSLYSGSTHMSRFLTETILPSYSRTNPQLVVKIFEELNQPLPAELESESSESEAAPVSNFSVDASECESISSSLISSPSEAKIHCKKYSTARLAGTQSRVVHITAQERAKLIPMVKSRKSDKSSVRRSLFTGTEAQRRRQRSTESTKRRVVLKTNRVTDTPVHKQVANANISKQARQRKQLPDSLIIIKETPPKQQSESMECNSFQMYSPQTPSKGNKLRLPRSESSPGKLYSCEGGTNSSKEDSDVVVSTPISKYENSPSPLTIPSLTNQFLETSPPSCDASACSPEIDICNGHDARLCSNASSPLLFSDEEYPNTVLSFADDLPLMMCNSENSEKSKPAAFDNWRIKKPCSENYARESTKRRKSESETDSPNRSVNRASASPLCKKMYYSALTTPVKQDKIQLLNGSSFSNGNTLNALFTSPTSLSLLHLTTSPVMCKK